MKLRSLLFYLLVIGSFSALIYLIIYQGQSLEDGVTHKASGNVSSGWEDFISVLRSNLTHPLAILLAQIITIIFAARSFGWLFARIGQPEVMGEIVAGIVLGPSLVGLYFPEFTAAIFPAKSLPNLQFLSQIGLILFMFVIGMELDINVIRSKAHDAVVISHASIVIPFALGMGLSYFTYREFAPAGISFLSFSLFMGIAMSITAFPVLARIVRERNIHKTRLGNIVITCAAADDITAWCVLAVVIAIVKAGSFVSALYSIGMAVAYVIAMLLIVRPFLKRVGEIYSSRENMSRPIVAIFFISLIISSYIAEIIGIHALFGAFMAGVIMPENMRFRTVLIDKVEDVATVLLLPLFFVFTGLRTQIGLIDSVHLLGITMLIIATAVAGKFIGSAIAARAVGQSWKDSLMIGALMNTRGLMELVVLNIGYDLGVLSPSVFAMLVIMALLTTAMTGPSLTLINRIFSRKEANADPAPSNSVARILFSFSRPESGVKLFRIARSLTQSAANQNITAMHLSDANELNQYNTEEYETESFAPLVTEAGNAQIRVSTFFKASGDIQSDIVAVANSGSHDLLLIGVGQSIFEGSLLGRVLGFTTRIINPGKLFSAVTGRKKLFDNSPFDDRTRYIISRSQIPVGVFVDRNFSDINNVVVMENERKEPFLRALAFRLTAVAVANGSEDDDHPAVRIVQSRTARPSELRQHDLLIIGLETWKTAIESKASWLKDIPSTLIMSE